MNWQCYWRSLNIVEQCSAESDLIRDALPFHHLPCKRRRAATGDESSSVTRILRLSRTAIIPLSQDVLPQLSAMDTSTRTCPPCASTEILSPLAPLQDTSAKPSPTHTSKADGTPQPNANRPPPNSNDCIIIIQNNYIAKGATINVFASR
ncbi:uncharacterized protein BJ212DRAFT_1368851 [Suillus subaureus]|uniref:Uncharacterized protein n=1 Tax=Suillus subaureus TaxID=48587 RepID=A0A9P7E6S0_9AGAM|nr:uncharacterized protein BJ212DRAFT_1368851 [Suillus subaureus]KAG1812901.1 hypothetical protein BJ212DRAFT_1368851 [Suillus subaureus]